MMRSAEATVGLDMACADEDGEGEDVGVVVVEVGVNALNHREETAWSMSRQC